MICLKLNWFFYGLSRMLQFFEFVWPLSYSVWDVFNNFLLIDATDRSKISGDPKRFFIALSLYPLSFFANTPFKHNKLNVHDTATKNNWCIETKNLWIIGNRQTPIRTDKPTDKRLSPKDETLDNLLILLSYIFGFLQIL